LWKALHDSYGDASVAQKRTPSLTIEDWTVLKMTKYPIKTNVNRPIATCKRDDEYTLCHDCGAVLIRQLCYLRVTIGRVMEVKFMMCMGGWAVDKEENKSSPTGWTHFKRLDVFMKDKVNEVPTFLLPLSADKRVPKKK